MSSHYITEPPPTAAVLLHTTAGPIQISLFATQTPLACRNFLQHVLDGYYSFTTFHRVVPGFVIQAGDPTGTGAGGQSIYEDRDFEIDPKTGEKAVFGDELHSRLKFNRRGLVGMAKMGENTYGSQFFITLGDVRPQLDGKCTMFGRVEGDGIYNIVRISEADNVEGTERPMYPFKITDAEVLDMPKGESWSNIGKRERVAKRTTPEDDEVKAKKKAKTKKRGKALLSFGGEEGDEDASTAIQPRTKINTSLVDATPKDVTGKASEHARNVAKQNGQQPRAGFNGETAASKSEPARPTTKTRCRRDTQSPAPQPSAEPPNPNSRSPELHHRRPSFHDTTTQLPLKNPESPSRSPSRRSSTTQSPERPAHKPSTSHLQAEIAALKASMRRNVPAASDEKKPKSALEKLIPKTSIRGRKRPRPGDSSHINDSAALSILSQFRAKLEVADHAAVPVPSKGAKDQNGRSDQVEGSSHSHTTTTNDDAPEINPEKRTNGGIEADKEEEEEEEEEAHLCDLHFIINCQSCSKWDHHHHHHDPTQNKTKTKKAHKPDPTTNTPSQKDTDSPSNDKTWMSHALTFEKDRLGKDLTWKRKNEEDLVVIDPREKEREVLGLKGTGSGSGSGGGAAAERKRKGKERGMGMGRG